MMIPAIYRNAHYLFEPEVLEFDRLVEIHVSRFGENQARVEADWVAEYPKYDITFYNPSAYKVYMNSTEPTTSPHRERREVVIENHKQYDLILTTDENLLTNCSNAVMFPYGSTWLNKGRIDDENAIGHYSSILEEFHKDSANIKNSRDPNELGAKIAYEYYKAPDSWELPKNATDVGYLEFNTGSFLYPHRDKWRKLHTNSVRCLCFLNYTRPTDYCFVYDNKIEVLEPGRWYAVNTQKVHYGFSFVDGVKHIGMALRFNDNESVEWILDKLSFPQPLQTKTQENKDGVLKQF